MTAPCRVTVVQSMVLSQQAINCTADTSGLKTWRDPQAPTTLLKQVRDRLQKFSAQMARQATGHLRDRQHLRRTESERSVHLHSFKQRI
jgi:hypothetical protein